MITHRLPLERALEGFELARSKAASKVMIVPASPGHPHAATASAFLALWNDFDPARDAEYECWHTFEHVPERVGIPGFLSGRRYVARERERGALLHAVRAREPGGARRARVRRRRRAADRVVASMRPSFRNFLRSPCATLFSAGLGLAGSIATFRFGVTRPVHDSGAAATVLAPFLESAGTTALHLGRVDTTATFPVSSTASPGPAEGAAQYVLLVEAIERSELDRAAPLIAEALRQGLEARARSRGKATHWHSSSSGPVSPRRRRRDSHRVPISGATGRERNEPGPEGRCPRLRRRHGRNGRCHRRGPRRRRHAPRRALGSGRPHARDQGRVAALVRARGATAARRI